MWLVLLIFWRQFSDGFGFFYFWWIILPRPSDARQWIKMEKKIPSHVSKLFANFCRINFVMFFFCFRIIKRGLWIWIRSDSSCWWQLEMRLIFYKPVCYIAVIIKTAINEWATCVRKTKIEDLIKTTQCLSHSNLTPQEHIRQLDFAVPLSTQRFCMSFCQCLAPVIFNSIAQSAFIYFYFILFYYCWCCHQTAFVIFKLFLYLLYQMNLRKRRNLKCVRSYWVPL